MRKITPFLWFDNRAEEAASFYTAIFNNSRVIETENCQIGVFLGCAGRHGQNKPDHGERGEAAHSSLRRTSRAALSHSNGGLRAARQATRRSATW